MIVLSTLNSKYIHASLGLRYLYANMGDLQAQTMMIEFTIHQRPIDIAEQLLAGKPQIIGLGVYIWNCEESLALVKLLKTIAPEVKLVLGGPEVSYECAEQSLCQIADHTITGAGDQCFADLCHKILSNEAGIEKVIRSTPVQLSDLTLPYRYYTDEDIRNRLLYVEASRGCPFKCEFCLSALDKTSYPFELERFLSEMEKLYNRGARHFKFVDRTFNLKVSTTLSILDFFLQRMNDELFLHFEVIPDHLPEKLKQALARFPEGSLQFEVGIQTFDPLVQQTISRRQNNEKSKANLLWLRENTTAHIHADLIFGLPGETMESFAQSFDQLYVCKPHEIQLGILKRLRGSPIIRHSDTFDMRYNPLPPYNILSNKHVNFGQIQIMNRFARYWDMIANSGRFSQSLQFFIGDSPFANFMKLSNWLFSTTGQTHKIQLKRLFELLWQASEELNIDNKDLCQQSLQADFIKTKVKGRLKVDNNLVNSDNNQHKKSIRQQRHLAS